MNTISVLVADDDTALVNALVTHIKAQSDLALAGTANSGTEAYEMILHTKPDVVILDLIMPVLDGYGVLQKLQNAQLEKPPKIIVYSMSAKAMERIVNETNVDYCMLKPQSLAHICDIIWLVTANAHAIPKNLQTPALEKIVTELLHELGFPANLKGYYYCRSAIIWLLQDKKPPDAVKFTQDIYARLSKQYGTTPARVERAMRHAIETTWLRGSLPMIDKYFGTALTGARGKPTNSEFIFLMADRIRLSLENGYHIRKDS